MWPRGRSEARDLRRLDLRHCPSCSAVIQKNGGCHQMRCACGHRFSWANAPRAHFESADSGARWPTTSENAGRSSTMRMASRATRLVAPVARPANRPQQQQPQQQQQQHLQRQELLTFVGVTGAISVGGEVVGGTLGGAFGGAVLMGCLFGLGAFTIGILFWLSPLYLLIRSHVGYLTATITSLVSLAAGCILTSSPLPLVLAAAGWKVGWNVGIWIGLVVGCGASLQHVSLRAQQRGWW